MQTREVEKLIQSWDNLFSPEEVKEHGLETPEARSEFFMDLWMQWEPTNIKLQKIHVPSMYSRYGDFLGREKVMKFANKHKLRESWDRQMRGQEVRFKDDDMALLFRLAV